MTTYTVTIDEYGTCYYKPGTNDYHRIDGPAAEYADGDKHWYVNGKAHRIDGPAIEYANGDKYWFVNGKLHRVDGPAIEYANGDKVWAWKDKECSEFEHSCKVTKKAKAKVGSDKFAVVDGVTYILVPV